MSDSTTSIDFRGARGSNTGDEYHELWALLQVLNLLDTDSDLTAVGVEGVLTDTAVRDAGGHSWDGVDCALYYGGASLESADRVEFVQLKYSAANPDTQWSVARLTADGRKSILSKMASEYENAKARMKDGSELRIRLVSNQRLSSRLQTALEARRSDPHEFKRLEQTTIDDLNSIGSATKMSGEQLQEFLQTLDFTECGSGSRFALEAQTVATVAGLLRDDAVSLARELRFRVRQLMLPERATELVTDKDVLLWLGVSSREALFPCPPDFDGVPATSVPRSAADDVAGLLTEGERVVLVHGEGGCGKTTLLHQIPNRLPDESVVVFFDCYGGGRYIHSNDKRHLASNAFVHLTNSLAVSLGLPLFIPRSSAHLATLQSFLDKLRVGADALARLTTNGRLVVVIDAADNAVAAATNITPAERPFVHDLWAADLDALPDNVQFVTSCRTARRDLLQLPSSVPAVTCAPFTRLETLANLKTEFPNVSDQVVDQFHKLSKANPRVQAYAIASAAGDPDRLLSALLPGGKGLSEVLRDSFDNALKKIGIAGLFEKLVGLLALLPPPIDVSAIARIAGCNEGTVRDLALDLYPGLRLDGDVVLIADEDFETFIRNKALPSRAKIAKEIADDFVTTFEKDPYSATHVADALIQADRVGDLLSIIEQDPQVSAVRDPIARRQVQVRRLKLSLASCKDVGSTRDALRTVLFSAEAEGDDRTLTDILKDSMDLSVEFAGPSLRREIILDRDRVGEHGSFLAQDAIRACRAGDNLTAREQLQFHEAWLKRRRDVDKNDLESWPISDRDVFARVATALEIDGAERALWELTRWRPRHVALRVIDLLAPYLIAAGDFDHVTGLLNSPRPAGAWDLLLLVPLAMAGEPVDGDAVEQSIRRIRPRLIPRVGVPSAFDNDIGWQASLIDTYITACELAYKLGLDSESILTALRHLLDNFEGRERKRIYDFEKHRIDGLLRCWLLREEVSDRSADQPNFEEYLGAITQEPGAQTPRKGRRPKRHDTTDEREANEIKGKILALFPIYKARVEILSCARQGKRITDEQLSKVSSISSRAYSFDQGHRSIGLRRKAAQSVMRLMIVETIEAIRLVIPATTLSVGRYTDEFASHRRALWDVMRLRRAESHTLVQAVGKAAEEIKQLRSASSDKLEAIVNLARLLLPVSRHDAESLFIDAVGIAKEVGLEAIEQIAFLSVLAESAASHEQQDRDGIAADTFTFVSGAAERLSDYDGFPWTSAVHALTCVSATAALAAIGRWADEGAVGLEITLEPFVQTSLRQGTIDLRAAAALVILTGGAHGNLHQQLVELSTREPETYGDVIELLAKETLLLSPQSARLRMGEALLDRLPEDGLVDGYWLSQLSDTVRLLRDVGEGQPTSSTTSQTDAMPRWEPADSDQAFEFQPQEGQYGTVEAIIEVLQAAEASGLQYGTRRLLMKMSNASSAPEDRVPFLNAVGDIPNELLWDTDRVDAIHEAVVAWQDSPAVRHWCRTSLPDFLVEHFRGATRWLGQRRGVFRELLDLVDARAEGRLNVILSGVAQSSEDLDSRTLFSVAEEVARTLDAEEASLQLAWYSRRLNDRLPVDDQKRYRSTETAEDIVQAVARLLYALMSDIDLRLRWKAAHALRRFACLGCLDIVEKTVAQTARTRDDAFRDPTAPFYSLASKLWLAIALYRISAESPESLTSCKAAIFDLATAADLPHAGIREYAKRTILQLCDAGTVALTPSENSQILEVNTAVRGHTAQQRDATSTFRSSSDGEHRFKFDLIDSIRYWYDDILRIFPTATEDEILGIAERWILDEWGADPEANWWDKEPRKARYDERRYALWTHSHGSLPTQERYGTHLEWNAMHCVVGELLLSHPISNKTEYDFERFDYWLGKVLPTEPPAWLSDHRGPTPLEARMWTVDGRTDSGWLHNARRDEFLTELGLPKSSREGWLVVAGHHTTRFGNRVCNTSISSALVSSETAHALTRALQTASDFRDYRIPDEDDGLQIARPPYQLVGWLARTEHDDRFDEKDSLRYDVRGIEAQPGRQVVEDRGLVRNSPVDWIWSRRDSDEHEFVYEAWCDEPSPERESYRQLNQSDGWRLWARCDAVQSFIASFGWDLIYEVQIERRLQSEYGRSYDKKERRKTHVRVLLIRADGAIEETTRRVGTWTRVGSRVGPGSGRRHT